VISLSPGATLVLAGAIVYAAGIGCALWVECSPTQTTDADVLSGLAQRNRTDFVREGSEAELKEICRQVKQSDPAMPGDSPVDLDFHFHDRAN
jgi:hypothetical protein